MSSPGIPNSDLLTSLDNEQWDKTHWVVRLSSGLVVYQGSSLAWTALKVYLEQNHLTITRLWLKFRSHEEHPLPDNQEGYFFRHRADGVLNGPVAINYYLIGYLQAGQVHIQHWRVPELLLQTSDVRPPEACFPSLIRCNS